nr:tRNA 2-thiouridine(34) synthase MnmA [bacterium]
ELMLKEPELDSDVFLATGHYAGISDYRGRPCIRRGLYSDQSYFLHRLTPEHIRRSIFPVGDMQKTQLREMVAAEGLHVANRPDSQEICFIHGKYSDFLNKHLDPVPPPGEIVDGDGTVIGRHKGIHHYTVGQRSGLGIAAPNPLYVVRIDTDTNRLVVGTREDVIRKRFHVENIVWSAVDPPDRPLQCLVQVRYRHIPVSGTVIPRTATSADVVLEDPRGAVVAAGQGAAFYMENNVLGGGEIR